MALAKILVVDDDIHMRSSVVELLEYSEIYDIHEAVNGEEALEKLAKINDISVVLSDIKMPVMDGIELLSNVSRKYPATPLIIMTAFGDISTAVDAMEKGAFYFIEKGSDSFIDRVEATVAKAVEHYNLLKKNGELLSANKTLNSENSNLKKALQDKWNYIGKAKSILNIKDIASSVAESKSTVLITGESGTGKELIAKSIHALSGRSGKNFVKVNCAALPEGLIESELFGHEKGAFTGALKTRAGKFELASGGTLLLDEIGEMPLSVQAKLLRVLQEREVDKVGGDSPVSVDVRIVATTNRELAQEVEDGLFREDLFYRLNVFHFTLPPLRDRKEDVEELAMHFVDKYNDENGFAVSGIDSDSLKSLADYNWPGNIRELENTIERAVVLTKKGEIKKSSLQLEGALRKGGADGISAGSTVAMVEKELILKTVQFCDNNKTKAADMLAISIRTLRNKLNEYGEN